MAQASMLLLVGFAFLRSGSYQRSSETSYGFRSICYLRCVPGSYRFGIGGRSVANRSLLVGIRSVLGRLSDGNWCFPLGFQPPKWGARKYYLHSPQPESGRCGLQVILLDLEQRENLKISFCEGPLARLKRQILAGQRKHLCCCLLVLRFFALVLIKSHGLASQVCPDIFLIVFCASLYAP